MTLPYPMPPRMNGPQGNPGRQPTFVQAMALFVGVVLAMSVAIAIVNHDTLYLVAIVAASIGVGAGMMLQRLISPTRRSEPFVRH